MGKKVRPISDDSNKPFGLTGFSLSEMRDDMSEQGVSSTTPFRGYCVHIPAKDEFLGVVRQRADLDMRGFCIGPSRAMRFPSYKAAANHREAEKGEIIVGLFETEHQLIVVSAEVITEQ
ncbi:hypothetical protein LCGC14_0282460 [marine sediment metagenome]|uniref:Uncharacterized protein n=1 Tax=marine sediment metagenome TaxID=412755 RepID=A0A0F9UCG1_9ZZZZ